MNQEIRNKLRNVVTQCRKLLEDSISQDLEGKYGIFAKKDAVTADPNAKMTHLSEEEQAARRDILDHFGHIKARGFKPREALDQLVREIAFTHLNRLCAYKMMEAREVYVGDQKFREAASRGVNSNGVKFYLADHPEEERLFNTGHQDIAYRHFLDWLGGFLSDEIGILFNPNDPANRLYPRQKTLDEVLDLLNWGGIKPEETELREEWPRIWSQDETIGWVYQYFTPKELRDQARKESSAPRNSYELAFRNQFFTPRYVVEFLTDNTLGRLWHEMRKGDTKLKNQCHYLVRRPTEIFLKEEEQPPKDAFEERDDLSQEELLKLPVYILHRPKKDPRELRILDPACGSGHFLLYCFDLLVTIYEEAYADPELGRTLQKEYPTLQDLRRHVPRLILAHNLHGIDIDLRASQIAALALWLRCQRAYQEMGLKKDKPKINRSNFVCAEPMPGEEQMLKEFVSQLEPKFLGQVVEVVFEKMKLAGEAGSLLKVEEEIRDTVAAAKKQWVRETTQATDRKGQPLLFTQATMDRLAGKPDHPSLFDLSDITDTEFFERAEAKVIETLRQYAEKAHSEQKLQRRLFTDDAVRGFAFVDLCYRRYDVVLMNPPFGDSSLPAKPYVIAEYQTCKDDIDAGFVHRGLQFLLQTGFLGAIVNRTQFFKGTLKEWREHDLLGSSNIDVAIDLGLGVLDGALVEAAAYALRTPPLAGQIMSFARLLKDTDKAAALLPLLSGLQEGKMRPEVFLSSSKAYHQLPESRISYWASPSFRRAYHRYKPLEGHQGYARTGLQTGDNFRFVRLAWEVAPTHVVNTRARTLKPLGSKAWVFYAKGGEYSPYFGDIHLVVDWTEDGHEIQNHFGPNGKLASRPQNRDFYFKPAITYTERTASGFSPRALPTGCIFDVKGPIISPIDPDMALPLLALLMTRVFATFLEFSVASGDAAVSVGAARQYTQGIVGAVPIPALSAAQRRELSLAVRELWMHKCTIDAEEECSRYFRVPSVLVSAAQTKGNAISLRDLSLASVSRKEDHYIKSIQLSWRIEEIAREAYGMDSQAMKEIDDEFGTHPHLLSKTCLTESERNEFASAFGMTIDDVIDEQVEAGTGSRSVTKKAYFADRRLELLCGQIKRHPETLISERREMKLIQPEVLHGHAASLVSYAVGCASGRWDVRLAIGMTQQPPVLDPFDPLPICPSGMLQEADGRPANQAPAGYPCRVDQEGVLVDDPQNPSDIVQRVGEVLELIWKNHSEIIEKEITDTLKVNELRDYFRKPSKGGFWDYHVSRYSNSRRNAPIYWLLQSSKRNYALWFYYHRLNKDLLFKALVNFVEPKIRLEASRLESVRVRQKASGTSGKESKRLAKEMEQQEDFISELRDFEDKLRRAADLHLEPDLNDGVVLNIAPLHELVPWKEAEDYWEELLAGKYEWSSIGKQLRLKGLVK